MRWLLYLVIDNNKLSHYLCCVNYRKSICPTMMSLLGLPKADTKSGSKAGSKDEMVAILGHVQ